MLHSQFGDIFIARGAQDQDGNLRRRAQQLVDGFEAPAIRQEEVHEDCRHARAHWLHLLPLGFQLFQGLGAASYPDDLKWPVARAQQRRANGLSIRRIVLD
jgi:hypothetical protein